MSEDTKVYAYLATDSESGREHIAGAVVNQAMIPLIWTDATPEGAVHLMKRFAKGCGKKTRVRLVELAVVRELEVIEPKPDDKPPGQFDTGVKRACPECGHESTQGQLIAQLPNGEKVPVPAEVAKKYEQLLKLAVCSECGAFLRMVGDKLERISDEEFIDLSVDERRILSNGRQLVTEDRKHRKPS